MAELVEQGKGGGKQKKKDVRVDFTPMVDMMMLLITFCILNSIVCGLAKEVQSMKNVIRP